EGLADAELAANHLAVGSARDADGAGAARDAALEDLDRAHRAELVRGEQAVEVGGRAGHRPAVAVAGAQSGDAAPGARGLLQEAIDVGGGDARGEGIARRRSEEHTSE